MLVQTLCLLVIGIFGGYCYNVPPDYDSPGNCLDFICVVEAEELPIRASWYDPALYNPETGEGKINCQEPCYLLGDGSPVDENYGYAIACPPGWTQQEIYFPGLNQTRKCKDSGPAIVPTCMEVYTPREGFVFKCFITVDFLEHEQPPFALMLLEWEFVV
jgi:hypothetical protein